MYIDSHAHLSEPPLLPHIADIMQRARAAQISRIVNICTHPQALIDGLLLSQSYPEIVNAGCIPPHDVVTQGSSDFSFFADAARSGKLVAVGETGLDYHYEELPRALQHETLKKYLTLALECDLPVVFHCREAFADLFALTDEYYLNRPAVLHCFTGTAEEALGVFQRGWYLSFSGIATFKKSQALRDVAKSAPLSQILIETDAPYLAPQTHRGKQNEPAYLVETAACLADAKGMPLQEIAKITAENAQRLFGL
ncbi:MAG TPA: TatD family deoxyribonuclease [Parachlamydiales bacterium]|nr:TatD family deoxyribonuclease [Parachlamydiales bacterium]